MVKEVKQQQFCGANGTTQINVEGDLHLGRLGRYLVKL
jgi:hypothetical protein